MRPLPALLRAAVCGCVLAAGAVAPAQEAEPPLLVVLTETGDSRDGLPVLALHPEPDTTLAVLSRGLSGEMVGVYRMTQRYLQRLDGGQVQPAYVLLSSRQGGFAKYGFWLGDARMDGVAYVDVHRDWALTGDFGAIDQVFPHELWHALRQQVVGEQTEGFANQVHALGVRTDRGVAFNEGFAEAFQALAVDHPDAVPETRALAGNEAALATVQNDVQRYARELQARLALATRWRTGFVLWYNDGEDVLRHHGVRANDYARAPAVPASLIDRDDPYAAYLFDSIVPAASKAAPRRSVARMLAIEGVAAALGYAWFTDEGLRSTYRDADFYAAFGTTAEQVSPLQNVWLKIVHAARHRAWDAALLIAGYRETFPDEAPLLDAVVERIFGAKDLQPPPELWLCNEDFKTGTTLFDQFRGVPREHTFDLNAASVIDLRAVPGIDLALAERIVEGAPYSALADLARIDGMSPQLLQRFEAMDAAMQELLQRAVNEEETLSIQSILMPSVWRLVAALIGGAIAATLLYRRVRGLGAVRSPAWWRAALAGIAATATAILVGWAAGTFAGLASLAGVALLFGLPAATICLIRRRDAREAAFVLLAWILATLPGAAAVTPLF